MLAQGARGDLQPKLLDFGAAKLVQGVDPLTRVGMVVGSPLYMSPEQARGEPVDQRTDLWSTCAVLYEAIVGAPPFYAENAHALLHAISTKEVRALPPSQELDHGLREIVSRGLTKNRDERWQTARDLMLELAAWLRAQGTTEDITGTALQGRGLGSFSSMPAFTPDAAREAKQNSRALATAVLAAQGSARRDAQPLAGLARENPTGPFRRLLTGRHGSPRFWSSVGAALLVSVVIGIVLHRSSAEPAVPVQATPAPATPAEPGQRAAPAPRAAQRLSDPDGDPAATAFATPKAGSEAPGAAGSAATAAKMRVAAPPEKRAAPTGAAPRKQGAATAPTKKTLVRPKRAAPFQNPFD